MKLGFDILKATTELELWAGGTDDPAKLKEVMLKVAADLKASAEIAAPAWGALGQAVAALEKGKRLDL